MANTNKTLRIERLLGAMRSDLARLLRRRAAGYALATTVSGGTADDEIAIAEANVARYERMLAQAYCEEIAALSAEHGLTAIGVAS